MKLKRVLLIDDDHTTNMYHTVILKRAQFANDIQVMELPEIALDLLVNAGKEEQLGGYKQNPVPELIFLDVNMPKMTGLEFLVEYEKVHTDLQSKPIIFMLTTALQDGDEKKCLSFNFVKGIIKKPLTQDVLTKILQDHF